VSGHQTLFDVLRLMPGMSGHHPRNVATENGASQVPSAAAASASLYSLGPRARPCSWSTAGAWPTTAWSRPTTAR
ncbi:hypothetical protein QUU95_22595, partial [Xanthomonas citri pv. citri]